ncbi:Vsp/OspC family lipoprotein (plasmid) [Borrelia miyamotoi]|uniref:Vsp/OspC family lipoprotein n=2 Tax=Borrelia miyamotoi TaxID=47466 RepID=A0AAQ3CNU9_9SPIR|nr:Vsp/OspC family lipoprotein [Borrelia miyamotoi]AHH06010.1 Variable outer membrane protein [Borrelia miyamotoi FR64b]ATQ16708.1 Vsp/OspC family lipoprotein [Borrelia miyamotoi]ATQ17956.1 Vsp/OspC family lipoprotein [Borrelia miyamotoi]ATQ19228.1 Vsp/OspC family lipoprotein [Borrelia miyamotoi]ATQ20493.1 Vsp/OspC family lipoprotein [Borrelia miyamotoi]
MKKRETLSEIKMTLFLIINIVMISCGSGGPAPKEGQAAKADGTVIDLVKISKKIKDAVDFAASVKEVHTLVKSIDVLAKGIGKKIKNADELDTVADKNGTLVAAVFSLMLDIKTKLTKLETGAEKFDGMKAKVAAAKSECEKFIATVKSKNTDLGKDGVTDAHAQEVMDITSKPSGDKGAADLVKLNTEIGKLLTAANELAEETIRDLTTSPTKAATIGQS